MTPLSTMRVGKSSWGRLVLSVFVVAWMNAALQPCLMAMEMPSNDTTPTVGHEGHENHESMTGSSTDAAARTCQHCPPTMSHDGGSCTTAAMADCDVLPDLKQGDRYSKLDLSDAHFVAIVTGAYNFNPVQMYVAPFSRDSVSPTYSSGPPINLKNCVFLK